MAEGSLLVDKLSVDHFICPVCLDVLTEPVTISCGHSFCKVCINGCWDQEDVKGVYSCPQCRETFTPRPVLHRNNILAEVVEKLKKTELQPASPAHCYAGPGDVECDFCTGRKRKAVKSCLVCLASYCEDHVKPHYQSPAFKKHKLVEACADLQEKICSQHDKLIEIYCRTDQSFICFSCTMDKHKDHDTVLAEVERTEKEKELEKKQREFERRIKKKRESVQDPKRSMDFIKMHSQAAVDDNERIFTELISLMEKKRSEVTKKIRDQEKAKLSRAERLLKQLEQEIADLKRRVTEMKPLSHTHDHIHFLQSFPSLCVSPGCEDSHRFFVNKKFSFDGVQQSLSNLRTQVEEIFEVEFNKINKCDFNTAHDQLILSERSGAVTRAAVVQKGLPSEPKQREDFLKYFRYLTLDPNTAHDQLILSERSRAVTRSREAHQYSQHPERFDSWPQVLCRESVCGRCYWEVECKGMGVDVSVSYKEIRRKGEGDEGVFGGNSHSWNLQCYRTSVSFWHNNTEIKLQCPSPSRIGVYVDHSAGTLCFYSVSDTMSLLHSVHTTFTQPLYAGFRICYFYSNINLCDPELNVDDSDDSSFM
ncbi:tripartite motif-containing protein 16-like [Clarias gariepinus]|uniref:tripartite motif-containing protein 16-like n=1 Tax=Clarias gariepinus TaxID=13013 RepID=UPI00234DAFB8|nr:tripartite motif-containing protein 16-like [Clarias gariepinus]